MEKENEHVNKLTKPLDVYLGQEFLKMAKVHGGFYYCSEELKTGYYEESKSKFSLISAIINEPQYIAPQNVTVILDGNELFNPDLLKKFQNKFSRSLKPDFNMVISDFQRVGQVDAYIKSHGLDKLEYKGDKIPRNEDFIVCIKVERNIDEKTRSEAKIVKNLLSAIKEALSNTKYINLPCTYSYSTDDSGSKKYFFVFFSNIRNDLESLGDNLKSVKSAFDDSSCLKDFCICRNSEPQLEVGDVYSCIYVISENKGKEIGTHH